jgi:hypothetical protein
MAAEDVSGKLLGLATELGSALERGDVSEALSLQMRMAEVCAPGPDQPSYTGHRLARRFLMRAAAVQARYGTAEFIYAQREAREEIEAVVDFLAQSVDPVFDPHRARK